VPNFALTDYRGKLVRSRALRGKVVLVTFLDTDCKTKCPLIASAVGDALRMLAPSERRRVAPLAVTVNPKRDTPARAERFLRQRQALGLDFLVGTLKEMRPVWRAFHIVAAAETGSADIHSADVRVYDRKGEWVSTLHLPPDLTPKNVAHDLRRALRERQS
jgi:protein SCO1/2